MQVLEHLSATDGVILAAYLLLVIALGLTFRRQRSTTEFLLANRSMGWLPIGLSVMASLFSANSFVFYPGEVYRYGLYIGVGLVAMWATAPIVMTWVIPFYVRSGCFTAYEVLEKRFDVRVRILAATLFILLRIGWMAAATFACSLAISVISGTNLYVTICVLGAIATVYTVVGGLKAVMWTDVVQFVVFTGATIAAAVVALRGIPGGWEQTWDAYEAAGKLHVANFRLSLSLRMGTWAVLIGTFVEMLSAYVGDQVLVQRYLSARSVRECRRGFWVNLVGVMIVVPGLMLLGVALHGFYRANPVRLAHAPAEYFARQPADLAKPPGLLDALAAEERMTADEWTAMVPGDADRLKRQVDRFYTSQPERAESDLFAVNRQDELMPFFVRRELPAGLIGLVLAALLAATMSSIDSGIHSVTTVLLTDVRNRLFPRAVEAGPAAEMRLVRRLTFTLGVVATVLACVVDQLGTVFDITKKLIGAFSGPLLAVFLLAIFSRRAKPTPVLVATIVGTVFALWLTYGTKIFSLWFCVFGFLVTWSIGYGGSVLGRRSPESREGTP